MYNIDCNFSCNNWDHGYIVIVNCIKLVNTVYPIRGIVDLAGPGNIPCWSLISPVAMPIRITSPIG